MPEKILGIDIGSSRVKVVQVTRGFRVNQMTGYGSTRLPADADPLQVATALVELISEQNLESDRYLVALPTNETFLRRLSFPFSAERKISQVIGFELEPGLPLPLNAVQIDFVKTEPRPEGTHGVLAAALPKGVLAPLLSEDGRIVPYAPTNTLIIKDRASMVEKLFTIIKGPVDTEGSPPNG